MPPLANDVDPRPAVEAFLAAGGRAVTFDVFDTLLWRRTLFPADAFGLLPHGRWGRVLRPRVEAVVTALCRRVVRREPRLSDIYGACYPFDPQAEFDLEARLTVANPLCRALVTDLLARGVPLLALSDMVLPGARIEALLRAAGYPALAVLSSADEGVSKRVQGRLFERALQRLALAPAQVLHVGDDRHADGAMAHQRGLASVRLRPPRETLLALHPALSARRTAQESLFWGEVALALHCRAVSPGLDATRLKSRLDQLLRDPGLLARRPQDVVDAWLAGVA